MTGHKQKTATRAFVYCLVSCVSVVGMAPPVTPASEDVITRKQRVLPLPGRLNSIPVVNSNSPEVVKSEGILLSTNSPSGKKSSEAHLDRTVSGRFDIFLHHINNREPDRDGKTLFIGVLLTNPGVKTAAVKVLECASYLSQPDAPFIKLESVVDNPDGKIFAGPGDRVTNELLRHESQELQTRKIKPNQTVLLKVFEIPVKGLEPQINGRSGLMRMYTSQPLCVATVATFNAQIASASADTPDIGFTQILNNGALSSPRDKPPSSPDADAFAYGRVAGVAIGNTWSNAINRSGAKGAKNSKSHDIDLPGPGQYTSFVVSSVDRGTHGTGQIQSAPLIVRYPDTAYKAHGNYGVEYDVTLNLVNHFDTIKKAFITFETPIKSKTGTGSELTFYETPPSRVFFRGTLKLTFPDVKTKKTERFVHLVQNQGQMGEKLAFVTLKPKEAKQVRVQLIYPPDATPPQVITIGTEN